MDYPPRNNVGVESSINRSDHDEGEVKVTSGDLSCVQARYVMVFMTFMGFVNCMATRASFNVALVAMVNFTASEGANATSDECPGSLNSTADQQQGEFNWGPTTQSIMLGSFFYGYVVTQFPGGYLAERFGGKMVFGLAVLIPGMLTLAIPFLARWDTYGAQAIIACRVLMGLIQGPIYPANQALWGKWAPSNERSRLISYSTSGALGGYLIALGVSGVLCDTGFLGGWPLPFYVFGASSILWFLAWCFLGYSSPSSHPRISSEERTYIERSVPLEPYENPPWGKLFTTRAFWVIVFYDLMDGIGFYIFFSAVPIYMKQILKFDMSQNGLLSSLPYLSSFIMQCAAAPLADLIKNKQWLSNTSSCKLWTLLGEGGIACFMLGIAFADCNQLAVVLLLTIGYGICGVVINGVVVNILDMAPKYAGTIMGLTNPVGNIGGFLTPYLVNVITQGKPSKGLWQRVFFMASGVYVAGTLVYLVFADAKEQPWASSEKEVDRRRQSEDRERLLEE